MDKNIATIVDITITTTVPSFKSSLLGQVTDFISERTSRKKRVIFSNFILFTKSYVYCLKNFMQCGRTGRNRTRNPRFWRPVLYQLNYCPAHYNMRYLALFMYCMLPTGRTELFQFHSVRMLALVAGGRIITIFAFFASEDNDISHFSILWI